MAYEVFITEAAQRDLADIVEYVAANDAPEKAVRRFSKIEATILGLSEFPDRVVYPSDLVSEGLGEYREVLFKPYGIIYEVDGNAVYVYLVADGRRDMHALLQRRLLEG